MTLLNSQKRFIIHPAGDKQFVWYTGNVPSWFSALTTHPYFNDCDFFILKKPAKNWERLFKKFVRKVGKVHTSGRLKNQEF